MDFLTFILQRQPCIASGGKIPLIFAFLNTRIEFLPPRGVLGGPGGRSPPGKNGKRKFWSSQSLNVAILTSTLFSNAVSLPKASPSSHSSCSSSSNSFSLRIAFAIVATELKILGASERFLFVGFSDLRNQRHGRGKYKKIKKINKI